MKRRVLGTPAVLASNFKPEAVPSRRSFTAADGAIGVGSVIYTPHGHVATSAAGCGVTL